MIEDLNEEELDRLIDWLVEYRRKLRGDCAVDCGLDHMHKRNGMAYLTRKVPLIRSAEVRRRKE